MLNVAGDLAGAVDRVGEARGEAGCHAQIRERRARETEGATLAPTGNLTGIVDPLGMGVVGGRREIDHAGGVGEPERVDGQQSAAVSV